MGTKSRDEAGTTRGASTTGATREPAETRDGHERRGTHETPGAFGTPSRVDAIGADAHGAVGVQDAYAPRAFVEEGAVETIHQANATFLALVARRVNAPETAFGVAPPIVQRLAALHPNARRRAAQCPYTLFDLRFADAPFWREASHAAAAHLADERTAAGAANAAHAAHAADAGRVASAPVRPVLEIAGGDAHVAVFALKAVFLAWHLARNPDGLAVVALGMTPDVVETWRGMPLAAFDRCAGAALPFLTARWGGHARFWPRLLDAAEHAGGDHSERVRLLGLQLLATETCRGYLPRRPRKPPGG